VANIFFHPETQTEYDAAIAWYQSHSRPASLRFEAEVERVLALIAANPEMYPK
jgi:hypothetical protein